MKFMQIELVILAFICNLTLGILLIVQAKNNTPRLALSISILAISAWNFAIIMLIKDPSITHPPAIWGKLASTFGVFIPMGLLWFAKTFREKKPLKRLKNHYFIPITILIAFFTLPNNFLFHGELTLTQGGINHNTGFYSTIVGIYYIIYFGWTFYTLYKKSKNAKNKLVKSQINFLGISSTIIASLILLTNMFLPIFNIYNFNGGGPVLSILFTATLFYIATHKRLMDMKLVLQQSLAYVLATLLTGIAVFLSFECLTYSNESLSAFLIFASILLFYPFRLGFSILLNYIIFGEHTNYKEKLRKIDVNHVYGQDFGDMVGSVMKSLQKTLNISGSSLLTLSENNSFVPAYAHNISAQKLNNPIVVNWLKTNKTIFVRDEMLYQNQKTGDTSKSLKTLNSVDTELVAAIYIPVVKDRVLQAIIVLEDKINNASFKAQEIKEIELILEKFTFLFVSSARHKQIKEDMKNKSKIKDYFHKGLFHEVNTPLTIANNFIEMAKWSTENKNNLETLENAQKYVYQSSNIIKQIVELNKYLSGDTKMNIGPNKIKDIIESLIATNIMQNAILTRNITLDVNKQDLLNETILVDQIQLVKALSNILSSIIDLNNLRNCTITISIEKKYNKILGSVIFKNPSNDETLIEYLKLPSYRIDKWLDTKKGQEGISLAISKAILERHKGHLNIYKKKKQTKVSLILPHETTLKQ